MTRPKLTLDEINNLKKDAFVQALEGSLRVRPGLLPGPGPFGPFASLDQFFTRPFVIISQASPGSRSHC